MPDASLQMTEPKRWVCGRISPMKLRRQTQCKRLRLTHTGWTKDRRKVVVTPTLPTGEAAHLHTVQDNTFQPEVTASPIARRCLDGCRGRLLAGRTRTIVRCCNGPSSTSTNLSVLIQSVVPYGRAQKSIFSYASPSCGIPK